MLQLLSHLPQEHLALIYNPQSEKVCSWANLIFGLPIDTLKHQDYIFHFPEHYLRVGEFEIAINGIQFSYFTEQRPLRAKNEIEAFREILSLYIFS